MKTETATVGTSLEVLAPYLPYGIEVEWEGGGVKKRATVRGIDNVFRHAPHRLVPVVHLVRGDQPAGALSPEWCLPVLRPFSQLCQPLEDGTVPAIEIGKRMHSGCNQAQIIEGHGFRAGRTCVIKAPGYEVSISEYGFNNGTLAAGLADLLREWHFAPLTAGKTLIEGVDYIAKSPAPTPIQEGRESHE